jgi:hypothetical protein
MLHCHPLEICVHLWTAADTDRRASLNEATNVLKRTKRHQTGFGFGPHRFLKLFQRFGIFEVSVVNNKR